jgi:hypothetical protein
VRNFTGQWLQARDITTVQLTAMDIYLRDHPNPQDEEAKAAVARLNAKPRSALTAEESDQLNAARQLVNSFPRQFAPPGNGNGFGNPDPKPQMTDSLRKAMLQETEMTFADVLKEDRSLLELLESNYTFLNEELAKHYGSDCDEARFNERVSMRHVRIDKQPAWSGEVRNAGLDAATGRIVCYLDADDKVLPWHFDFIAKNFGEFDWVWFDDLIWPEQLRVRELKVEHIGTGCFAHLRSVGIRWTGGYCYDWAYLEQLIAKMPNHKYIGHGGYVVCHIPHKLDV